MGQSIEKAARNADAIRITGDGRYVGFRVRGSAGYTCAAFAVQADTPFDTIVSSSAALLPLPTASVGWSQPWLSKNVKTNGSLYFTVSSSGAPVVSYNFQVKTNAAPVTIRGAASTRGQGVIVSTDSSPQGASPCWN